MLQYSDPFAFKERLFSTDLSSKVLSYKQLMWRDKETKSDTSLVYLVLKTNLVFDDRYYLFLFGLEGANENHWLLYQDVCYQIHLIAETLHRNTGYLRLIDFPLTDIKETCYVVGMTFKPIFFVPVMEKLKITVHYHTDHLNDPYIPLVNDASNISDRSGSSTDGQFDGFHQRGGYVTSPYSSRDSFEPLSSDFEPTRHREENIIQFASRYNQMWVLVSMLNKEYTKIVNEHKTEY